MSPKPIHYGLRDSRKPNPNLIIIMVTLVILAIILVFSGRHSRITFNKVWSIEANIPPQPEEGAKRIK